MRLFVSLALVLALVTAPIANAQTVEQLQQQIAALLAQVTQLQTAINAAAQGGSTTNPGSSGTPGQACLVLSRNLAVGSSGEEVTKLQQFLAKDATLYPEGQVTGYYGQLTMQAVQRWQARYGVVSSGTPDSTGYGAVGPMTRRAFAGCGDVLPAQFGGFMRVTPVSGPAPLTVSVTATINTARSCDAGNYKLDFGDNTAPFTLAVPAQRCAELEQVVTHTYNQPGTYTVALGIGSHRSTVTVTVTAGTTTGTATTTASNSCGVPPTQPPAASCVGVWEKVYNANSCHIQWRCSGIQQLNVNPSSGVSPLTITSSFKIRPGDPYEIVWGDNTANTISGSFTALPDLSYDSVVLPSSDSQVNVQHTYSKTGTFTVSMRHGSYEKEGNQWIWRIRQYAGTVNITGTNVADGMTVSTASGSAPFTASFTTNINGAGACDAGTYTIDFGDNSTRTELTYPLNSCTARMFTITHNYTTGGTYTAKLFKGTSAQVGAGTATQINSLTIQVSATGASSGPFTVLAGVDGNARKVQASFTLPSAESCNSYQLDWGDSSAKVTNSSSSSSCTQAVITKIFTHTYSSNGTYTLRLKRGPGPLSGIAMEETATVSTSSS